MPGEILDIDNLNDIIKPKGKVRVELFDCYGKKRYEQKANNFISQGVLKHYFKRCLLDTWLGNVMKSKRATALFGSNMFYQIVLTTAAHQEDPINEWVVRGQKTGYALTYSASSSSAPLSGTLNVGESYVNLNQAHLVFDFPTDRGNGTFRSIYFIPDYSSMYDTYTYERIIYNKELLKIEKIGTIFYAYEPYNRLLHTMNESFNITASVAIPSSIGTVLDFTIKGSEIFYITSSYAVFKAPLSSPNSTTKVKDTQRRYTGMAWVAEENRFYCAYENGNYQTILDYFDASFNILGSYTYTIFSKNTVGEGLLKENNGFIRGYAFLDRDSMHANQIADGASTVIGTFDDKLVLNNYDDNYIAQKINFGSRCLLSEPVVKTSADTMKITYDFYFQ